LGYIKLLERAGKALVFSVRQ